MNPRTTMKKIKIDSNVTSWFQTSEKYAFLGDAIGIMPDGTEVVGNIIGGGKRFQFASDFYTEDGVEYTILSEVEIIQNAKKFGTIYYPNSGAGYIVVETFDSMEEADEKADDLTRIMREEVEQANENCGGGFVEHGMYVAKRIKGRSQFID